MHNTRQQTHYSGVIVLWLAGLFAAMQFAKFSISYDDLFTHYKVSGGLIGLSLSVVGFMGIIFGTVAGVMAGRMGYKNVLIFSLLIGGMMSALQSLLPTIQILLITRLIEGISHLGIVVTAPTIIIALSAKHHQSITMGLWGTFFGVAFAIAGWLGVMILQDSGLQTLYISHAILAIPITLYLWFSLENTQTDSPTLSLSNLVKSLLQSIVKVYQNPNTFLPSLVFLFHTCMFVALLTFVPRLTSNDDMKQALLVSLPLISIAGTFLSGAMCQYLYIRPQTLSIFAYTGVAVFILWVVMLSQSAHLFFVGTIILLFFSGIVQGATFAMIPHMAPTPEQQAQSNGSVAQMGNLGATLGPPIFAITIDSMGMQGVMIIVLALCIMGIIVGVKARNLPTQKN